MKLAKRLLTVACACALSVGVLGEPYDAMAQTLSATLGTTPIFADFGNDDASKRRHSTDCRRHDRFRSDLCGWTLQSCLTDSHPVAKHD